jgi:hypothetical protein
MKSDPKSDTHLKRQKTARCVLVPSDNCSSDDCRDVGARLRHLCSIVIGNPHASLRAAQKPRECGREQELIAWILIGVIWVISAIAFYILWNKRTLGL